MRTYISVGHNEYDKGTHHGNIYEWDVCKKISEELFKLMPKAIPVPYYDLKSKIAWINQSCKPNDLAIEIHLNSNSNSNISGTEVYYAHSPTLANIFAKNIAQKLDINNRGGRHDSESFYGSLGFLRNLNCKSVIIEVGYLSNTKDRSKICLPGGARLSADGIFCGIMEAEKQDLKSLKEQLDYYFRLLSNLLKNV